MANSNKPSHEAFAVNGDGRKSTWTRIGAAWPNEDGKGYNIVIARIGGFGQNRAPRTALPGRTGGRVAPLPTEADNLLSEISTIVQNIGWQQWRKDELINAIEALVEAHLIVEHDIRLPDERAHKQRFAAAMTLLSKS